jgi:tetratricopeptide (TPR) repeat protein
MTPAYLALGKSLAGASKWDAAALAFEKAYSLDPTGPSSKDARAELHYARARVLEAAGKPAEDELEQALAANPEHPGARSALTVVKKTEARARGAWMLWAAAAAGGAAVVLFALGMRRRRAA